MDAEASQESLPAGSSTEGARSTSGYGVLRVPELRLLCKQRAIPAIGTRKELLEQLEAQDANGGPKVKVKVEPPSAKPKWAESEATWQEAAAAGAAKGSAGRSGKSAEVEPLPAHSSAAPDASKEVDAHSACVTKAKGPAAPAASEVDPLSAATAKSSAPAANDTSKQVDPLSAAIFKSSAPSANDASKQATNIGAEDALDEVALAQLPALVGKSASAAAPCGSEQVDPSAETRPERSIGAAQPAPKAHKALPQPRGSAGKAPPAGIKPPPPKAVKAAAPSVPKVSQGKAAPPTTPVPKPTSTPSAQPTKKQKVQQSGDTSKPESTLQKEPPKEREDVGTSAAASTSVPPSSHVPIWPGHPQHAWPSHFMPGMLPGMYGPPPRVFYYQDHPGVPASGPPQHGWWPGVAWPPHHMPPPAHPPGMWHPPQDTHAGPSESPEAAKPTAAVPRTASAEPAEGQSSAADQAAADKKRVCAAIWEKKKAKEGGGWEKEALAVLQPLHDKMMDAKLHLLEANARRQALREQVRVVKQTLQKKAMHLRKEREKLKALLIDEAKQIENLRSQAVTQLKSAMVL